MSGGNAAVEVGFIFQCTLCGSYSLFSVDALDPVEVSRNATHCAPRHKLLAKDVHNAEEDLLLGIQRRLMPMVATLSADEADKSREGETTGLGHFVLLPCAACIEISTGRLYSEWLDDRANLSQPAPLAPHVAVTFEAGELPPAYMLKANSWSLAQGVGPKDLEVKKPHRLPAGQFRVILPPDAPALRPSCWAQKDAEGDPEEVWERRRTLIDIVAKIVATRPAQSFPGRPRPKGEALLRAPPIGEPLPWLAALCSEAEEAWRSENHGRAPKGSRRGAKISEVGGTFVRVPLLSVAEELQYSAAALLTEQEES